MKTLHVIALLALLSVVSHAQDRSDADATYALKGPVKTFRTEVATFVLKDGEYVEGPRVPQMEAAFNSDGNRTDLYLYNRDGKVGRRIVIPRVNIPDIDIYLPRIEFPVIPSININLPRVRVSPLPRIRSVRTPI